jgi:Ser/Thr protein kinase RdoA (MazF antagonist)
VLDDAGGRRRGLRAEVSPELLHVLQRNYAIAPSTTPLDLGGSSNLNLLVVEDGRKWVARVYRPSVSRARLGDIQRARRRLAEHGFPCVVPLTASDGNDWIPVDDRLLEVEEYVEHDGHMDTWGRVESGLRVLARMHGVLESVPASTDGRAPQFVNYVAPGDVVEATARGTARIRSWSPTSEEARLADAADELATSVGEAEQAVGYASLPRQLLHGDFWDNNVLCRGDHIVLIHDFDHMGERARIEDLALTLYYMSSEASADRDADPRMQLLGRMVNAYDSGQEARLSAAERSALPVALARQPLWSVGGWIAELDDDGTARSHAAGTSAAVELALEIMRELPRWQESFLAS